jgi:O-antigen/teichoic acid export membrane protein
MGVRHGSCTFSQVSGLASPLIAKIVSQTALYGGARALVKVLGVALVALYARALSKEELAVFDLAQVWLAVVMLAGSLDIAQGYFRVAADVSDAEHARRLAYTAFRFVLGMQLVFFVATVLAEPWLTRTVFGAGVEPAVMWLAGAIALLGSLQVFLLNDLRWRQEVRRHAGALLLQAVSQLAAAGALVGVWSGGLLGALLAQTIGLVVSLAYLCRSMWSTRPASAEPTGLGEMLRYSAPLVVSSGLLLVNTYADRYLLRELAGLEAVAYYGVAWRVAALATVAITALQVSLVPALLQNYREPGTADAVGLLSRGFGALGLFWTVVLILLGEGAVRAIAGPGFEASVAPLPLLGLSVFLAQSYMFAPGLSIGRRTGVIAGISAFCALGNVGLNVLLIPEFAEVGAAGASVVSAGAQLALFVGLGRGHFRVRYRLGRWIPALLGLMAFVGLCVALTGQTESFVLETVIRVAGVIVCVVWLGASLFRRAEHRSFASWVRSGSDGTLRQSRRSENTNMSTHR